MTGPDVVVYAHAQFIAFDVQESPSVRRELRQSFARGPFRQMVGEPLSLAVRHQNDIKKAVPGIGLGRQP